MNKEELTDYQKSVLTIIDSNGYTEQGYGYKKVTEENTHWITLFDDKLQMYAYFTEDEDFDTIYDTGIVKVSAEELNILIKVLNSNHN